MSTKTLVQILLLLLLPVLAFHFAIILKIFPYQNVWGGRLKNNQEMYVFEGLSIFINFLLIFILLIKANYLKSPITPKWIHRILLAFLFLFILNTVGNMLAKTSFEKFFSVITLQFSILLFLIIRNKESGINKPIAQERDEQ